MPRPVKCRKVCHFPNVLEFLPADGTEKSTPIVLTVDEYETIRLLDKKRNCKLSGNVMTRLRSRTLTDWKIWIFITGLLRLF